MALYVHLQAFVSTNNGFVISFFHKQMQKKKFINIVYCNIAIFFVNKINLKRYILTVFPNGKSFAEILSKKSYPSIFLPAFSRLLMS